MKIEELPRLYRANDGSYMNCTFTEPVNGENGRFLTEAQADEYVAQAGVIEEFLEILDREWNLPPEKRRIKDPKMVEDIFIHLCQDKEAF